MNAAASSTPFTAAPRALPTAEQIAQRLRERLAPQQLRVIDESHQHAGHAGADASGAGTHFRVQIRSPLFVGQSRVAQHRLVYDSLQDFIDQGLHALAIEAEASPPLAPPSPDLKHP